MRLTGSIRGKKVASRHRGFAKWRCTVLSRHMEILILCARIGFKP